VKKPVGILACALLCLILHPAVSSAGPRKEPLPARPLPAKGDYATGNYGLTFEPPDHATYCPLPDDWVGSDHGTVVFLEPPRACYGAGYPSSARGFEPADVPRIEIFYGYDLSEDEDEAKPPPCKAMGTVTLFGKKTNLCRGKWHRLATANVEGKYKADEPAELSATLVAKPADLSRYMPRFIALIASIRTCNEQWAVGGAEGGKTFVIGQGARCPPSQWH
jgi:hypothetical protein